MKKKLLFWVVLGGLLIAPALGQAVTSSSGGGGIDWEAKVGKPENDPNSPSSYESKMGDTQKTSSQGGFTSKKKSH